MENENHILEFCHINHPVLVSLIPESNFINSCPNRRHWLPVSRLPAILNAEQLSTGGLPGIIGKILKIIAR